MPNRIEVHQVSQMDVTKRSCARGVTRKGRKQWKLCREEEEAFRNDQRWGYHNTRMHNHRGELIIDLSRIKELIREDIQDGKHQGLTPSEFQNTRQSMGN